ncbi:MAG TPA: RNA polymerase sigma factor [Casimicrobiaceae bacterium]|nr:RNA polymerase sigma factor [Casimicrobiaceae bacterium]
MPAPPHDADEQLMLAYAAGRAQAFDTLYARHKGPVFRYLVRHCNDARLAEELFQDVWTNVIRARASYAPVAKFTTWLYTLAHNRLVDHWRSRGQLGFVSIDGDDEHDEGREAALALPGARTDEPETRASAREIGARIAAALVALPAVQRDAFLLQQEAGLSLADIAALTGAGEETVKSRLRYATARLRAALADLKDPT